eukprot:755907-Hanusia_phi.AAC.3
MGKTKKKGKASRFSPYGRDTTRITDLCNMLEKSTANTLKEGEVMEDGLEDAAEEIAEAGSQEQGKSNGEEDSSEGMTRGKILQRHKKEWRALRCQLDTMKSHKKAMGAGTLEKKNAKKTLGKEIKTLEESLKEKHRKELEDFDKEQKQLQGNSMNNE